MSSKILIKFAEKLKKLRKERGLSQEALALLCDIDRTYIVIIENKKINPSLEILNKIAKGLGIKLIELLDFE